MLVYASVKKGRGSERHPAIHSARHSPVVAPDLRFLGVPESGALPCTRHVRLILDGMYRYRRPCSFNTMPQLINRSDWRMVTSQSLRNHGQMFSIGERSGERAGQSNSRTFFVSKKVGIIPATCGREISY
ncbi:hypothetical protein TNCV_4952551 [Trichonephila clavipes]|nr:hypothetical protein TNCV_4952551 [Trichonephila clavipes]